ncbi:MAG: DUF2281 domain-containing protein [Candidatus Lokiarchaeota archaeon]|nr:DUF2281 domain-containing protein [Candidatus Lokiarchaeota archaeon]
MSKLNIFKEKKDNKEHKKDLLKYKRSRKFLENLENSILSEPSLKKLWLSPEEDEAWEDL